MGISQQNFWKKIPSNSIQLAENAVPLDLFPDHYTSAQLNYSSLKEKLAGIVDKTKRLELAFPMPDGTFENFIVWESSVMEDGLAAKYPGIKTFQGRSLENPEMKIHFDYTYVGFHASIYSPESKIYIWPMAENQDEFYLSFHLKDFPVEDLGLEPLQCGVHDFDSHNNIENTQTEEFIATDRSLEMEPVELREYKIAMAAAGEYSQAKGGTISSVLSTFATSINILNQILEVDLGARLVLVDNTDNLIFLDPGSDPYSTPADLGTVLNINPTLFTSSINENTFDIGHTFTNSCPGGGVVGLAGRPSVCNDNIMGNHKSRGATCHFSSNVSFVAFEIFSHEVGHQFAANHSFNYCQGNEDNVNIGTGYEPGGGSTIMSYSGSCGNGNFTNSSDPYFNNGALEEMLFYTRIGAGNGCATKIDLGNHEPELELPYSNNFHIPISTPFELTAIASDPDNDPITYCWEQHNVGPSSQLGFPMGNAPTFRSFPPVNEPNRIFPRIGTIVNNGSSITEILPTYSRDLAFTCTVRDNHPEGGTVVIEEVKFKATEEAGPFLVTNPNLSSAEWEVGDYVEVNWDIANTDQAPVNCQKVNIKLSLDGGFTYPITLIEGTFNSGSAFITVPDNVTNQARVKVEAADNIFFDISNANFSIVPASEPGYSLKVDPIFLDICTPTEETFNIITSSLLGYDSLVSLEVVSPLPAGAEVSFSSNPFLPSEGTEMILTFADVPVEGEFEIVLEATAPDLPTSQRSMYLDLTYSNFAGFAQSEPADASSGVSFLPDFSWTSLDQATYYDFELADNPAFGPDEIVDSAYGLTETDYTSAVTLNEGTIYYWRVRPGNECRAEDWPPLPFAFNTTAFSCVTYEAFDLPKVISGAGTPTVESQITIPNSGTISDINVAKVTGVHQSLQYLNLSLRSPEGTERKLFANFPCTSSIFNDISFDDEAPSSMGCPPATGANYQPKESFEIFKTEDPAGVWTLVAQVNNNFGEGGSLDAFELELCSDVNLNGPYLVTNETLAVRPESPRAVSDTFLLVQDDDNGPFDLVYTLVKEPEHGTLYRKGNALSLGDEYNQNNVNFDQFYYFHNGDSNTEDRFHFTVTDGEGGWIGITQFNIIMDPDAPVLSVDEVELKYGFTLVPNPAKDWVELRFDQPLQRDSRVDLYNTAGQRIRGDLLPRQSMNFRLAAEGLPAGIYWVQITNEEVTLSRKLIIQK
jgi:hypothetical protein